jgi:hypothetical protein
MSILDESRTSCSKSALSPASTNVNDGLPCDLLGISLKPKSVIVTKVVLPDRAVNTHSTVVAASSADAHSGLQAAAALRDPELRRDGAVDKGLVDPSRRAYE